MPVPWPKDNRVVFLAPEDSHLWSIHFDLCDTPPQLQGEWTSWDQCKKATEDWLRSLGHDSFSLSVPEDDELALPNKYPDSTNIDYRKL